MAGNSFPSAPPWEIQFCSQIPWTKFCEDKRLTFLFDNVLNWDDSAGKEAFDNAKTRYWAEINNLQCDISLPNPDMYIDIVNHDTFLDPQVVEDLCKPPPPPPHKEVPDYNSIKIIPTGWDVVDPCTTGGSIPLFISAGDDRSTLCGNVGTTFPMEQSRCGYAENPIIKSDAIDEPFTIVPTGWGDEEDFNSSHACNLSAKGINSAYNVDSWDISYSGIREMDSKDSFIKSSYKNSPIDRSCGNGRDGRRFNSKHTSVRHHGNYYRVNNNSRGCSGRRNYSDEYYWHGKGLSCAPGNLQR